MSHYTLVRITKQALLSQIAKNILNLFSDKSATQVLDFSEIMLNNQLSRHR